MSFIRPIKSPPIILPKFLNAAAAFLTPPSLANDVANLETLGATLVIAPPSPPSTSLKTSAAPPGSFNNPAAVFAVPPNLRREEAPLPNGPSTPLTAFIPTNAVTSAFTTPWFSRIRSPTVCRIGASTSASSGATTPSAPVIDTIEAVIPASPSDMPTSISAGMMSAAACPISRREPPSAPNRPEASSPRRPAWNSLQFWRTSSSIAMTSSACSRVPNALNM